MHVISKKKLRDFWVRHATCRSALQSWFTIMHRSTYETLNHRKATFPSADRVGKHVVFDVGGNKCRVITVIHFNRGKVYVRDVLTHQEYDQEAWKR